MTVKWVFTDTATSTSYTWEVNANEGGVPSYKKNIVTKNTLAPGGKTLIYEGQDEPLTLNWTGTILTQTQYDAFVTWFQKRHQFQITDHLAITYWVYITEFVPTRQRAIHYPWKFSYTMSALILDI